MHADVADGSSAGAQALADKGVTVHGVMTGWQGYAELPVTSSLRPTSIGPMVLLARYRRRDRRRPARCRPPYSTLLERAHGKPS